MLNGQEIAGGSVRIHDQAVQSKVFKLLGMTPESVAEKFSFLLEALSYGLRLLTRGLRLASTASS